MNKSLIKLGSADKVILLVSIIMLALLFFFTWTDSGSDRYVSVYIAGEKRYIIDLMEEKTLSIDGVRGVSKLEVIGGKVRFIASPCSSHFCIRSGWLNHSIGILACLPNRVSLHFSNRNNLYDAINF